MILLLLLLGGDADRPTAVTRVRILVGNGTEIAEGAILIQDGKIAEIGKDVKVPEGAKVVDARGWTAMPGMVHAASRLGLARGGDAGGVGSTPHHRAADEINPSLDVYDRFARAGFTAAAVHPGGVTVSGVGALLKPVGGDRAAMLVDADAFLRVRMRTGTPAKDALRQALDGARKAIEAQKKDAAKKPDEKTAPVARFLNGELPGLVEVSSPAEILHFWQVLDGFAEFKPRVVLLASSDAWKAAEELGRRKAAVILRPELVFAPFTRDRVNPAAELARAGVTIAFAPPDDRDESLEGHLFRVMELVKHGLPRETALRALATAPAELLGADKRLGSLEKGKDADLLLFDGDPLSAKARLRRVFLGGREIYAEDVR
ncbi:MAG TPA: amidohydrolase family protein [Planctomycetota bacterium]